MAWPEQEHFTRGIRKIKMPGEGARIGKARQVRKIFA
jgi:hypothetical protein